MEELILIRKKNEELLKKNLAEEISDQCCKYFEDHCNQLLHQTKAEAEKFFSNLRKKKILKICLGTTLVIAGAAGFVAGILIDQDWLSSLGTSCITMGTNKISGKNNPPFISSNTSGFLPNPNIDLEKYRNGTLTVTFNLCFGTVFYPL